MAPVSQETGVLSWIFAHHKAVWLDALASQVLGAPVADGGENGHQAAAQVGHGVFHPGRNLRIDGSGYQAVPLQLPKLQGQHPGGGRDVLLKLGEAEGAAAKPPEDQRLVFSADEGEGGFNGADVVHGSLHSYRIDT